MNKKFDVVSQILRNAEIAPKKIAVEDMSGCLTYEQLVQQSMNLKQKILSRYMEGATICVDLGRCKERVIALVAILAANASYLPFELAAEEKRNGFSICTSSGIYSSQFSNW